MKEDALCQTCPVRDRAICSSLTDDELCGLRFLARRRQVCQNQIVCWAGEEEMICANVVGGMFKISAGAADGRDQIVGLLYPGDFIGNPSVSTNRFTITALTASTICVFPRQMLQKFMGAHVQMERLLLARTQLSLEDARLRILLLAQRSAEARIARFLLDTAVRALANTPRSTANDDSSLFELPLSRAQVAEILGLTSETVSRGLSRLKQDGVIALPRRRAIVILDHGALTDVAEA